MKLDAKIPAGPLAQKWDQHKFDMKLVNPANKRKFDVIVVGTRPGRRFGGGQPGGTGLQREVASAYQDSPRRAHSIAAQGGINAAKNYPERRRQRLPSFLRHDQGRRFPRARGQCLPAGAGQREYH